MTREIKINAHITTFHVVEDHGDGRQTILAEHRRYSDALAAARLMARETGLEVEEQPSGQEGGAQ